MAAGTGACLHHRAAAAGSLPDAGDCLHEGRSGALRAGDGLPLSGRLHHRRGDAADGAPPSGGELHSRACGASHGPAGAGGDGCHGTDQHVGVERGDGLDDAAGRARSGAYGRAERRHRSSRISGLRELAHDGCCLCRHHRRPCHDARHRAQCFRRRLSTQRAQQQYHLRAVADLRRSAGGAVSAHRLVGHHPLGHQGSAQAHRRGAA